MKRLFYLLFCFAAFPFISHGQGEVYYDEENAGVVAQWSEGDTALYRFSKKDTHDGNDDPEQNGTMNLESQIHLRIMEAAEKYYVIQWTYGSFKEENSVDDPQFEIINHLFRHRKLVYRTTETGTFEELVNWIEVRREANHILDSLAKASKKPTYKTFIESFRKMVQNKESITQLMAKEITYFHYLHGLQFSRKEKLKSPTEIPNLLDASRPFPGWLEISVEDLDEETGLAHFAVEQTFDEEQGTVILMDIVGKLMKRKITKTELKEMGEIKISDDLNLDINLHSGWPQKITFRREVRFAGIERTNEWVITRIY